MATGKFLQVQQQEGVLTFVLGNGLKVVADEDQMSEGIRQQCLMHGLNQKVRDAAAGFSKTSDYSGAFSAMQRVVDNLLAGLWNDRGGAGNSDLAQAVSTLKGIELHEAEDIIAGLDDEQMKVLMGKAKVKAEIAKIKAERAAARAEAADEDEDLGI